MVVLLNSKLQFYLKYFSFTAVYFCRLLAGGGGVKV